MNERFSLPSLKNMVLRHCSGYAKNIMAHIHVKSIFMLVFWLESRYIVLHASKFLRKQNTLYIKKDNSPATISLLKLSQSRPSTNIRCCQVYFSRLLVGTSNIRDFKICYPKNSSTADRGTLESCLALLTIDQRISQRKIK